MSAADYPNRAFGGAVPGLTDDLIAVLQRYSIAVTESERADGDAHDYLALRSQLERALEAWKAAIYGATGVLPLPEIEGEGEDEFEYDHEYQGEDRGEGSGRLLTVVSRFDMAIQDSTALVAFVSNSLAGDEVPAPAGVVGAIDRVVVAHGHPWWQLPGVEVLGGGVAIIDPDETADPSEYSDELTSISPPRGNFAFFEGFTGV